MNVGILSVGSYLPPEIRTNDWWPQHTVDTWRDRFQKQRERALFERPLDTPGAQLVQKVLSQLTDDPFQGAQQRHVMPKGMTAADMELSSAKLALERCNIDPQEIGLVLSYTMCPDYINAPSGCRTHDELGLSRNCITMGVDAVCNSFLMQMTLAEDMIKAGRVKYALLLQTSAITRLKGSGEPYDAWFGDGSTAVVVGAVEEGLGIIATTHRTDGTLYQALLCGVPGGHWSDSNAAIAYSGSREQMNKMVFTTPDHGKEVLDDAFSRTGTKPIDVDFYASHQAFRWFRSVTQEHIGMSRAKSVDTFPWAGTLSAANLPLVLDVGHRERLLKKNDLVAMYQGGTGTVFSGMLMRWSID